MNAIDLSERSERKSLFLVKPSEICLQISGVQKISDFLELFVRAKRGTKRLGGNV